MVTLQCATPVLSQVSCIPAFPMPDMHPSVSIRAGDVLVTKSGGHCEA